VNHEQSRFREGFDLAREYLIEAQIVSRRVSNDVSVVRASPVRRRFFV